MPSKGDDLDKALSDAVVDHLYIHDVEITPKGIPHPSSKTHSIKGSYSNVYFDASGMASSHPNVEVLERDINGITTGAGVTVRSIKYTVTELQPDGGGSVMLLLKHA